jgi:mono/diheme cytochrome c family protein
LPTAWPPTFQSDAPEKAVYGGARVPRDTGAGDGDARHSRTAAANTKGVYQIRSTASGSLPTDADMPDRERGNARHCHARLVARPSERERADVSATRPLEVLRIGQPELMTLGSPPGESAEGLAEGRQAFEKLECFKCHGQAGRGDGQSAPTLKDDADFPIRAADLTESWHFNGGADVAGIYARLRTGLDGTPMPSFSDAIESQVITDEQLWRVAQYVRSLSPGGPPAVSFAPGGPAPWAWRQRGTGVEAYYVPLVGQIVQRPRWFTPGVDGIWVRAMHDGQQLALRVSWSDPSKSPDPEWQEWLDRIGRTVGRDDTPPSPTARTGCGCSSRPDCPMTWNVPISWAGPNANRRTSGSGGAIPIFWK